MSADAAAMPGAPGHHPYRWVMLFGASLVYACFGALLGAMSVLVQPISDSMGLNPLQMGTVLGSWQFVYLFASIPTGAIVDRFGLRPCLLAAGLLMAGSSALRLVADSYAALLLAVMIFGAGGPLISVGAPKLVSRWFDGAERGLAMGIYMSSTVVGALLAMLLTNSVIRPRVGGDWQATFGVYTAVMLVSVVIWLVITAVPISRLGDRVGPSERAKFDFQVFPDMLRDRRVRLVLLLSVTLFFFLHTLHAWLPEVLRTKGMTLVEASNWASLPSAVAIVAALIVPRLAVAHRRLAVLAGVAIAGLVSSALLEIEPISLLIVCLVGLGIARSCLMPIALLVLMELRGLNPDSTGAASGLFFAVGQIGGVLGPVLAGMVIALTGSFDSVLWLMAAAMALLLAIVSRLRSGIESEGVLK